MRNELETKPPTEEEIKACASVLSRLPERRLPLPIFKEICKKVVLTAFEVVSLRTSSDGQTQVLLSQRPDSDLWYPGEMHSPGVMLIPSDKDDENFVTALERLKVTELEGLQTSQPMFVANKILNTKRGVENANIHWMRVSGEPTHGKFYDIDNLPDNLINHHKVIIKTAYDNFLKDK